MNTPRTSYATTPVNHGVGMMKFLAALTLSVCLGVSSAWAAVPLELPMQGVIYDNAGAAASGSFEVTFALYPSQDASPAQAVWWETTQVEVNDGVFVTRLGLENPLDAADFSSGTTLWLGMAVESDPELPRRPLGSSPYALHAATAGALDCSACIGVEALTEAAQSDLIDQALAAVEAQGYSSMASGLSFDDTNTGMEVSDVQSAIEQLKTLVDEAGESDVDAILPPDALGVLSNGLLKNVFVESFEGNTKSIPDNNPGGVLDEIIVPDVGIVQEITVSIDITNADISGLVVTLFDPLNNQYLLHDKTGEGAYLEATFPDPDETVSGDLNSWVDMNAKGTWRLIVADWQDNGGGFDGAINSWSVTIKYLSSKKIVLKGDLVADGQVLTDGGKSNCFVKDVGDGFSAVYCGGKPVSGFYQPNEPLMRKIYAGGDTSCGILLDKTAMCWGNHFTNQNNPPELDGEYEKFAMGSSGGCGLRTDGSLKCWSTMGSPSEGVYVDISCTQNACCGVRDDESVACWGTNNDGQLNPPLGNYVSIDGGYRHFCALTIAGDVKCWGNNNKGQTTVPQTNDIYSEVSMGNYHSCALRESDGYVRCWGKWDNDSTNNQSNGGPYKSLSGGGNYYHCGILYGDRYRCWGDNSNFYNSMSNSSTNYQSARPKLGPFISIETSRHDHVCAVRRDLTPVCWGGNNSSGKLKIPQLD